MPKRGRACRSWPAELVVRLSHDLGLRSRGFAEADQKRLIRHEKIEDCRQKVAFRRPGANRRRIDTRVAHEGLQRLGRFRKEAQGVERQRLGVLGIRGTVHRQGSVKSSTVIVTNQGHPTEPFRGHRPKTCVRISESIVMDAKTKTVLIVEDNELNMKLFHDLLDAHGYNILQTKDGMEALDIAREHHPDLILMDIQLPEVSGLEVTKWIKEDESLKSIPVVAVTAFAMKGDEEVIRQGGCEAYISKPISVTSFLETVRRFIG